MVKRTFAPLLHKVKLKLAKWKGKFLSMAGRTTLIKSVLSAIPQYQMQSTLVPKGVLSAIEKLSRDFFWNQHEDSKKLHLLSWDVLKQRKSEGGLGIKDLHCQNKAFLMKLCWSLIKKPDAFWVRCLREKYSCGSSTNPIIQRRRKQSAVWSGIVAVWEDFKSGLGKCLKSGRNTLAWKDCWSPVDQPLESLIDKNIHLVDKSASVRSFTTPSGHWDRAKWASFLPTWVVDKIMLVSPPIGNEDDKVCWRIATDGNFSVRSAYDAIYHQHSLRLQHHWQSLWHWGIPERVKIFLWQVFHNRLPTNELRARHNPSVLNKCPFQCDSEESTLHMLRDCEHAQRVWSSLTNPLYYSIFFSGNLQDWLNLNLHQSPGNNKMARWQWHKVFSYTCWLLWKNRCSQAFEGVSDNPKGIIHRCLYHLSEGVENGRYHHQIFQFPERGLLHWHPPDPGFHRIDVDGSVIRDGQAACGGVIRDHQGIWIRGFQQKLGHTFTTAAEIHAIHQGLLLCKKMGLKKIKLFTDSLQAIHLLSTHCDPDHPLYEVILDTRSLVYNDWELEISHTYRESIRCADYLAGMAHGVPQDYVELGLPPMECIHLFALDRGLLPHDHL